VHRYELLYGQFFGLFCDRSRAVSDGEPYMFDAFLPEIRDAAGRLRLRILDAKLAPVRPFFVGAPLGNDRVAPLRSSDKRLAPREAKPLLRSPRRLQK
jgi:hypothetical protein